MRVMLAGVSSGCGKTTASLALMAALRERGMAVAPFKAGPDYIDPGFHRLACGRVSHNLDEWLCTPRSVSRILDRGMAGADIGVIEGAMGFYDGLGGGTECSAFALAEHTRTPVVLVVDASGSAASAAATALGFLQYRRENTIAGVLVNRVASERHYHLVRAAMERIGLVCVGWLPKDAGLCMPDRHLGLVPVQERPQASEQIRRAASVLRLDPEALVRLARRAGEIDAPEFEYPGSLSGLCIGLAEDAAFSFVYEANLTALEAMGARLVRFSPLADKALPEGLHALYLPGGFPEIFEDDLKGNASMAASVRRAVEDGLRVYAECGGMLYLSMIGALPLSWEMTGKLQRFGYVSVRDEGGLCFPAHEFHHSLVAPTAPLKTCFEVSRGDRRYREGYSYRNVLAGYPHLHFFDRPALAERLFL
ncbi:MAG: cobyrinate a,c-diamide synthase [Clostridia bacterium]|nr:cobyrinate a,c-diamide synthase [Clostridia bacterium]